MSAKRCAREECGKTVYPLEELKCLDKVWHKQCFKCTVCGMTLSMKNYKGYDKKPYCEPHYPKTVASAVADTPEMRRIAENTKNQSQVKYHAEYEKMKGTKIEIADDPELQRHRANMKASSQVAYTGELDKKKRQDESRPFYVATDGSDIDQLTLSDNMSPQSLSPGNDAGYRPTMPAAPQAASLIYSSDQGGKVAQQPRSVGSIADYDPLNGNWGTVAQAKKEVAGRGPPPSNGMPAISPMPTIGPSGASGFVVKAIYDYTAGDRDEVSFLEGDVIVNCEKVDEGWMTGTVQRTLQWGMLPANYVQPHKLPTGLGRIS